MKPNQKPTVLKDIPQPLNGQAGSVRQFKAVVAQLKTPVSAQSVRGPVAPPVYRPQPVPKVLQTKSSAALIPQRLQTPRQPVAPAVYRPRSSPKVVLPKMTNAAGNRKPSMAPRVQLPQPTPKVLQTKRWPAQFPPVVHHAHSIPKVVQTKKVINQPAPAVKPGATVQLASRSRGKSEVLKRPPFSAEVKREVAVASGEHRRHIIPNHLMKHMLQSWWDAHKKDKEGKKTSFKELEEMLKEMNNYIPNLIPGEGASNSAIGMLATAIGGRLEGIRENKLSAEEIAAELSRYRGFVQWKQKELMKGVLKVFKKDDDIKSSAEDRVELAEDVHFSADFDWPGGKHWDVWFGTYERFKEIEDDPEDVSYADLMKAVKEFGSLPEVRDPGRRSPDRSRGRGRTRDRMQSRRRSESRDERSISPDQRSSRARSRTPRGDGPASRLRSRRKSVS